MDTKKVVPPSGLKKNHMSTALAVVVRAIEPPAYLNVAPASVTVRLGVASLVRIRVNDVPREATLLAADKVNVQLSVSVAVYTVPLVQAIVCVVPVLPIAVTLSENTPVK